MSKITKIEISWHGLIGAVARAIRRWEPQPQKSEHGYRDALIEHLRACAPDARVEKEYRVAGTTADVYVKMAGLLSTDEVYLELKRDLGKKADCDRLVGQVADLDPRNREVIVVLFGQTDPALLKRLEEQFRDFIDDDSLIIIPK